MRASEATAAEPDAATSAAADEADGDASDGQNSRRLSPKQRKALMKEVQPSLFPSQVSCTRAGTTLVRLSQ